DLSPQLEIARALPTLVGLPCDAPLLLEAPAIRGQHPLVLATGNELSERALAEVVDEYVLRASKRVPGTSGALGIVVVLQKPQLVALVKWAEVAEYVSAHRQAEHRRDPEFEALSAVLLRTPCREPQVLAPRAVIGIHLRLVADAIGRRSHQPDAGIVQVRE